MTSVPVVCRFCGLPLDRQRAAGTVLCPRCRSPLPRRGAGTDAALATSLGTVMLLVPAILEPFLTTSALGASRTSILPSSVTLLWRQGWPLLATVVCLFLLVFPVLRFGALATVLTAVRLGRRAAWLRQALRLAQALESWAMLDVFLLAFAVAYARLRVSIFVTIGPGAVCFIGAALLSLFTRALLDRERTWQALAPEVRPAATEPALLCQSCDLRLDPQREGSRCPRCRAVVRARRAHAASSALALLSAAVLLYVPANVYPIATIPIDFKPTAYTVIGGIQDLAASHFMSIAVLVFCVSLAVPFLKIAGLTWCAASVLRRSGRHLPAKTRTYRWLEEIGRWSMIDPFTIACFVPVLHYNALIDGRAEPAAMPFTAVVVLTMVSVKLFDPRRMWDVA